MDKVAAVVVTYNRSALLLTCLNALSAQTRPVDAIYIIDNASIDDTEEVVVKFSKACEVDVIYYKLQQNVGGAGGFAFGSRLAHSDKYDQIWLMDDDGVPARQALAELLAVEGPGIRNSLVVDIDNHDLLAFPLSGFPKLKTVGQAIGFSGFLNGSLNPFNGTLVSSGVFDDIGFPYQGFFIWGDEVDFVERARRAGFGIGTVSKALHYHPTNRKEPYKLFGIFTVNVVADSRLEIYMRNYAHNICKYKGYVAWLKFFSKQLMYEIIISRSIKRVSTVFSASATGIFLLSKELNESVKQAYAPALVRSFKSEAGKSDEL